jgi:cell wall assembly regulator SMI1
VTTHAAAAAAALERLEAALAATDHPLVRALRPGLDADEIATETSRLRIRVPDDAAALWRWHDGVDPAYTAQRGRIPGSELLPGGGLLMSLDRAVEWYVHQRDGFPWEDLDDWSIGWFPAIRYGNGDVIWVDCSGAPDGPTPMILRYNADYNSADDLRRRRIFVTDGIEVLTALVERGIWAVDPRTGGYDFTRDPDPDLETAWLV